MSKVEQLIIEITSPRANLEYMQREVTQRTGATEIFFCPPVVEGKTYNGHVHIFPPSGASNVVCAPIRL
jgi:hypothetical protein